MLVNIIKVWVKISGLSYNNYVKKSKTVREIYTILNIIKSTAEKIRKFKIDRNEKKKKYTPRKDFRHLFINTDKKNINKLKNN